MNRSSAVQQLLAVVFAVLMVTSICVPLVGATAAGEDATAQGQEIETVSTGSLDTDPNETEADGPDGSLEEGATVDDAVEAADGTTEVIVRFDRVDPVTLAASDEPEDALRAHSDVAQQAVIDYAERTDGVEVRNRFWLANAALVTLDADRVDVRELATQPGVTEIHENFEVNVPEPESVGSAENDEADTTYGLEQINTTDVWDEFGTRGEGVKIAVLDTGVDVDHPDLDLYTENPNDETYPGGWAEIDGGGNVVPGSTPYDTGFHGTHVSGTVAGGNESGTAIGVAPEANLMHGLVLPGGQGGFAQIIGGMEWAVEEDADVISMSLGADGHYAELIEPVRNAEDAGTLVVGAAGNSGPGVTGSPGNVYETFAIGASDEAEAIASFSGGEVIDTGDAWGSDAPEEWPDEYTVPNVAAPGADVLSAIPEGYLDEDPDAKYASASGTSMATPHVSGVVALMQSAAGGQLSTAEVTDALEAHAWKPDGEDDGVDARYGHGIVDALAATETSAVDSGITGTVENVEGESIAGATVSFGDFPIQTDGDGEYEVNLAPGEYEVEADAFGHQPSSTTVTVEEDEFAEQNFELDLSVESILVEGQPLGIEDGDSFDVEVYVENLEEYEVSAGGEYPAEELTVSVDGDEIALDGPVTFDEPISDDVTITVEAAENTSGDVSLEHTFSGYGVTETLSTGPTGVFDETVAVGVVDRPSSTYGDSLATHLQATAPWFDVDTVDSDELEAPVDAGEYDVYVVQHFGDADVEWFIEETETPKVGVVYLDQFAGESNAINQYVDEAGNPNAVVNATGSIQQPTVGYQVSGDHPFFDAVGEDGEFVGLYTSPAVLLEAGYHATMQGFDSGDYGNTVAASTAISGSFGTTTTGTGLAEDQFTRTVWAPSLGQGSYAAVGDSFEPEAYEILTNVVEYANGEPAITPTSPQDERLDPGEETTVTAETPDLESVTVDLAAESTLSEANLTLTVNDEPVTFGETLETTDESLTITAETDGDVTGSFSLEYSVVTAGDDGSVETEFSTGQTSVYEAPLEVPQDVESIQHALDLAVEGEEIVVDDGTYEEAPESAPINWGPALWIETDGITLRAADGADPTVLYDGDDWTVQNGIYVTGDDVHIDGLTINKVDGEAVEGGMAGIVTDVYEGTPTTNLTVTDVTHAGHRGVMIEDGVTGVTIDGLTAVDASGIAGSYSVVVMDGEVEDSTAFDPELHDFGDLDVSDVDFEELAARGLDFNDVDVDALDTDELSPDDLDAEALDAADFGLEELDAEDIAEIEGVDVSEVEDDILPDPDPTLYTEDIHITNAVMEEASNENAHGIVLREVRNVTVEDSDLAHEDLRRSIFFQSDNAAIPVENVTISNVTAEARTDSDSVIRLRSASATIEDTTIEDGVIGIRQDEAIERPLDDRIEVYGSTIDVREEGIHVKHDTEFEAELNEIDAETGVQFSGEIDPDDVTVRYNDLSETDVAAALDGTTVGADPIDARLNYLGPDYPPAAGNVELSPALPESPGDEAPDFGEIDAPTVTLDMEAGGLYAVGVPGPTSATVGDVLRTDVHGVVYGFDADSQSWTLLSGDDSLETLQALMVAPEEDTVATLEFDSGDAPPGPGQTGLTEGWNFVTAPYYGDAAEVFGYATSEVSLVTHTYDRPGGQLAGEGGLDGTLTEHDGANVSPFEGYFVFAESEGTLPAHLTADPDLFQLYEQLRAGDEPDPEAEFEVQALVPEETTVDRGDEIDVEALLENTGDEGATQIVEFRIDGEVHAATLVELDAGESAVVEFDGIDTGDLEGDTYEHGVYTDVGELTGTLTVEEAADPAYLAVSDLEPVVDTVADGAEMDVSATVTNVGDEEAIQTVEYRVGDEILASTTVSLDGGESELVAFDGVEIAGFEPDEYDHGVYSDDDEATGSLTIEAGGDAPASFQVTDLEPENGSVVEGETINVSATVTNAGDEVGEQTVDYRVDGDDLASTTVSLDGGESEPVAFDDVEIVGFEPDEYDHGVYSDDDEATGALTIEPDPENAETSLDAYPDTATFEATHAWEFGYLDLDGEEIESWTVDYTGTGANLDGAAIQDIDVVVTTPDGDEQSMGVTTADGDDESSEIRELQPGLTGGEVPEGPATLELPDVINPEDADEYEATVTFRGDGGAEETFNATFEISEIEPATFAVAEFDAPETVDEDEPFDVESTIENLGDLEDTQDVEYRIVPEGENIDDADATFAETVTLDYDEAESVDFADVLPVDEELEPGTYEHGVFTANDSATETLEIHEIDGLSVGALEFESPDDAVANQPFEVSTDVTNFAGETVTDDVELRMADSEGDLADADAIATEELTLEAGETTTLVVEDVVVDDHGFDADEYALGLFSEESGHAVEIEIHPAAEVELDVEPGTAGEGATHTWEIELVDFGDVPMDSITADYGDTGANFSDVVQGDVSVALTDQGDDEPTDAYVNGVEFADETAEIDVGSSFLPVEIEYSTGPAEVVIENLENPDEADEFEASLEFVADDGTTLTYIATFELSADGSTTVSSIDATTQQPTAGAAGS